MIPQTPVPVDVWRKRLLGHAGRVDVDSPYWPDRFFRELLSLAVDEVDGDARSDQTAADLYQRAAEEITATLIKDPRRTLIEHRASRASFQSRLRDRWGTALILAELSIKESWNGGHWVNDRCRPIAVGSLKFEALIRLHARAVMIGQEIVVLLHGGFSTGALARWRTIHEVWVVFSLLLDGDEELARRYLNHDAIESMKGQEEYEETWHVLGYEPLDWTPADRERERARLAGEFGDAFLRDYGWAAPLFGGNAPSFRQLQELAQLDHWRSHYRMASHGTHANPKGLTWSVQGETTVVWAGPSNTGLVEPAQCMLIALANITAGLLAHASDLMMEAGELIDPHRALVLQKATLILMTAAIDRFAVIDEHQTDEERTIEALIERSADALRDAPLQTIADLSTRLEVEPDRLEEVLRMAIARGRIKGETRYEAEVVIGTDD